MGGIFKGYVARVLCCTRPINDLAGPITRDRREFNSPMVEGRVPVMLFPAIVNDVKVDRLVPNATLGRLPGNGEEIANDNEVMVKVLGSQLTPENEHHFGCVPAV